MNKVEKAIEYFKNNYNCSQSIFAAYGHEFGIPIDHAFKVASGFGGGMRIGGTCGAVTGAFMVHGLKFAQGKNKPYDKLVEFADRFCQRNQSTNCIDLIGCDIRTDQGMKKAISEGLFTTFCTKMVKDAAEILETMITDDR